MLNFPAINAIKRASPNTQIDVWVKEYNVELAQANRNISNVLTLLWPINAMKSILATSITLMKTILSEVYRFRGSEFLIKNSVFDNIRKCVAGFLMIVTH